MNKVRVGIILPGIVFLLVLFFSSCRTTREIPASVARPISTNKLLKKIEQNSFDYSSLSIRRISCQFSDNQTKANFRISLKAQKNEKILVSITKLQVPVGRVLLTPDSVKYVNYIDQNYFVDDYSYLSDFLNIDLDFATIESIIANNAFSYRNDPKNKDFRTFDSFIEEGKHVLQSEKEKKLLKLEEKENPEKTERRFKRLSDEALVLQKMFFNPGSFTLSKLTIQDNTNSREMEMAFEDFTKVNNKEYPSKIEMRFNSPQNNVNLKVNMSGFSTEKINSFSLRIPQKYQQITVN
jgi:hypothetical protein